MKIGVNRLDFAVSGIVENARAFFAALAGSNAQGYMMDKVTNTTISRAFSKAARWQIIITVLISGVSLLLAGVNAAISALAGGASVIVGGYAGMLIAQSPNGSAAGTVLITLLKAEVVKILVIAILLLITFQVFPGTGSIGPDRWVGRFCAGVWRGNASRK